MSEFVRSVVDKTLETVGGKVELGEDLLQRFFDEFRAYLKNASKMLKEKEYIELAIASHRLAGACAYFGLLPFHCRLLSLEELARAEEIAELKKALSQLLKEMRLVLREEKVIFETLSREKHHDL